MVSGRGWTPPPGAVNIKIPRGRRPPAAAGLIVSENDFVSVALVLSVARITNEKAPSACGVPLKVPAAPSSKRPAGKVPESRVHVTGGYPPVAANVSE